MHHFIASFFFSFFKDPFLQCNCVLFADRVTEAVTKRADSCVLTCVDGECFSGED